MLFAHKAHHKTPFRRGRCYRVLRDYTPAFGPVVKAGEILTYRYSGTSIYDEMDGFFFVNAEAKAWRRWDISFYDDLEVWTTLFQPLPRRRGWWLPRLLLGVAVVVFAIWIVMARGGRP